MKFRYKVLITNIIVISICLGTIGYLMIVKNFNLALEQQIQNSIEENNLFQASIEYELLSIMNTNSYSTNILMEKLEEASENVYTNMSANSSQLYVAYNNNIVYSSSGNNYIDSLWNNSEVGKKSYTIIESDNSYYIYVTSCNLLLDKRLNIINQRDITSIYTMMIQQSNYYKLLLIIVLIVCSIFMFVLSVLLTKPLEKLQKVSENFGNGDYDARININSNDEVGKLANTYNTMADSVEDHMNELKAMVTRQEQFVADFTHEIKTPMTSIIGYADTLRSRELSREQQIMAASYIFSEGRRLEAMSMKLFEFIYTKQHTITTIKLPVRKIMNEVTHSVEPLLATKNITLTTSISDCYIPGDLDLLKSAFINLIDNSRKASKDGGIIVFSSQLEDSSVTISVQDFGRGIPKEHLDKICDAFYMVDKSRSRKEGGAGLGLSLSSLIFHAHNAQMNIKSKVGQGTTFSITLPLYKDLEKEVSTNEKA